MANIDLGSKGKGGHPAPLLYPIPPARFATIPHTTVNSLFFKTDHFSTCKRCPLGSGGLGGREVCKIWDPKNQIVDPLGFAMIPLMAVRDPFF